jgi:hypothetical protein
VVDAFFVGLKGEMSQQQKPLLVRFNAERSEQQLVVFNG